MATGSGWRLAAALALWLGSAGPVLAQSAEDSVVDQLRAQGYVDFTVSRTLLGRVQVIALGPSGRREVVFNPATGEILRDYFEAGSGSATPRLLDRDDDDGDDDDGDDDDGDDDDDADED